VTLSVADAPVSLTSPAVTVGALVSSVKVIEAVPVPAELVSLATIVWTPSASPVGV
jgi:hypothetical protein